jgi:hypothetical protein
MKRVMILTIICLAAWPLMAQPEAGKLFLGGNARAYSYMNRTKNGSTTQNQGSTTYLTLMPLGGYFLSSKIAVGAGIGIDSQIDKNPQSVTDKTVRTTFEFSPFGRYYLISEKGGLFLQVTLSSGFGSNKSYTGNNIDKQHTMSFSALLSPGVYYYITPKLALEATFGWFGFTHYVTKPGNDVKDIQNSVGFDVTPDSFSFGLTFML